MFKLVTLWLMALAMAAAQSFDIRSAISSDGLVHGNDRVVDKIFREPRDYSVVLILTAEDDKYNCGFCKILGPEMRQVAQFYNQQNEDKQLFFVLADLDYSRQTFQSLSLDTAPHVFFYEPESRPGNLKKGVHAPHEQIPFSTAGPQVDYLISTLNRKGFSIRVIKPVRYDRIFNFIATLGVLIGGTVMFWPVVHKVITSKKLWLAVCLVLVLMFISGHMFNITRHTPFIGANNNKPEYILPQFGSQFAVETQILSVFYAVLAFCTILLLTRVPELHGQRQTVTTLVLTAAILVVFSALINVFKIKNGGFPFGLLDIKFF